MTSVDELAGKVAVVTGGGSGFGAALCHEFARVGMAVAAVDIDARAAQATAASLAELGVPTLAIGADVGDTGSVRAAASRVEADLGGCDVLCANVGVQQFGAIDRLTEGDWSWVLNVNVMGTIRTVDAFLPLLRRSSGFRQIVLTASSGVFAPGVRLGAYQTSKYAVWGYGDTLRLELAPEGIGVTVVFPAGMQTRHLESSAAARPAEIGEWVILPDDIEAMMASRDMGAEVVASPGHAVRNVVADLVANEPYIVTHGDYRAAYRRRLEDLEAAFDRMEDAPGDEFGAPASSPQS